MALTDTIQCDGVTTSFTLTRAVTTKESLSLTIASGVSAGLVVSPSDYTFSPVNSVSQSVTITWANAVNYGTIGTPVDVTVAIYHNPGADPADTLLYSYDSASAMRPEMVGRDLEHIIDLIKMVIGGADLATTSLGDQEDDIAAAVAINVIQTADIAVHETRLDTNDTDIAALEAEDAALRVLLASAIAGTASTAADVLVVDAGGYFAGVNAETVLAEIGAGTPTQIANKLPLAGGTMTGALIIDDNSGNPIIVYGDNVANADGIISIRKDAAATNQDAEFRIASNGGTALSGFSRIEHGSALVGTRMWDHQRNKGLYVCDSGGTAGTLMSGNLIYVDDNGGRTWSIPMWVGGSDVTGATGNVSAAIGTVAVQRSGNVVNGATASARDCAISRTAAGTYQLYVPTVLSPANCVLTLTPITAARMYSVAGTSADYWTITFYDAAGNLADTDFGFTVKRLV